MHASEFNAALERHASVIDDMQRLAHSVHNNVNQTYDKTLPYGFHLDMVADNVKRYGAEVCADERDVLPMMFGAYFHDSIEDARLTYNDLMSLAKTLMGDDQALTAVEIAYALTNEKGRTRAERANDRYYAGIRATPYAPLVKLADRLANMTYSNRGPGVAKVAMREVYKSELDHFLDAIDAKSRDQRFMLPAEMVQAVKAF